jgi:hypothetical protein
MKTFKQFIKESFDSQHDFRDRGYKKKQSRHSYDFNTKDDKIDVTFDHDPDEEGVAHVDFQDKKGNIGATGTKGTEAIKLFSTVHKIMQHHAAQHPQIKKYRFLGQEGSRSRLYDRLVKKVRGKSEYGGQGYQEYNVPADRLRAKTKKKKQ